MWCPRRELNPHLILRTDLLYPLSYKGIFLMNISVFFDYL